jgi:hypothetical protein
MREEIKWQATSSTQLPKWSVVYAGHKSKDSVNYYTSLIVNISRSSVVGFHVVKRDVLFTVNLAMNIASYDITFDLSDFSRQSMHQDSVHSWQITLSVYTVSPSPRLLSRSSNRF